MTSDDQEGVKAPRADAPGGATAVGRSAAADEAGAGEKPAPGSATPESVEAHGSAAELLLDEGARRRAAAVDDSHPFGHRGKPLDPRSPLRLGMLYTLGAVIVLVLAYATYTARSVLVLIVISAFLAIGLDPAVTWLQRHGLRSRGAAASLILLVALGAIAGFIALIGPPLAREGAELVASLPGYVERLEQGNGLIARLNDQFGLVERARGFAETSVGPGALTGVLGFGAAIFGAVFNTFTVLILALYFLVNYTEIKNTLYRLAPLSRRPRVGLLGDEMLRRSGGYVLGNLATSAVAGVTTAIFLWAIGVPYSIALGVLVAILDLIPLIGATIAAIVVTAVAFFVSVPVGIAALVFMLLYQQFENYVLVPKVMERTVDVSPVTTIVAVLLGGALLGVLGALIAIPLAAAGQLVLSEVYYPRQDAA